MESYSQRTWNNFVNKVVLLYEEGYNSDEIALKLDTSEAIVEKVIEDFDLNDDA